MELNCGCLFDSQVACTIILHLSSTNEFLEFMIIIPLPIMYHFFYSHTTNSSYTALFLTAPRVRIISRCAFKFGRDKDNGIQFPRLIKFVAPALLDVGRSKFPMCRDGSYQGNPSSGASVAHQPSASRYRMTAQLARKREKERECRVATPFRGAPPTAS